VIGVLGFIAVAAQPPRQIVIAIEQDPNNLNPVLFRGGTDFDVQWTIFDSLVETGPDLAPRPLLAESWSVSPDGLTYTFNLRKGIKWHDGQPFTADDVAFTYYAHLNPKVNSTYRVQLSSLAGFEELTNAQNPARPESLVKRPVDVVDPHTVRFNLRTPNGAFLTALTNPRGGIVPRHLLQNADLNTAPFNLKPIGTGPFRVVEWRRSEAIILERNAAYPGGPPALDRVIFRIVPERVVQLNMIKNGEIQFTRSVPLDAVADLQKDARFQVITVPEVAWRGVLFNLKKPVMQDRRVRLAIGQAINRDVIIASIGRGFMIPATGPITPNSWAYNPAVSGMAFDLGRAKSLLTEAGWRVGADGVATKDGERLAFTMIFENFEALPDVAVAIQEQLRQVGIQVQLEKMDFGAWLERLREGRYDLSMVAFGGAADPDVVSSISFHSSGGRNLNGYRNPAVDQLLEGARRSLDVAERRKLYLEFQRALAEDMPALFLYHPQRIYVIDRTYQGWEKVPVTMGMFQSVRRVEIRK
jgi:peptide/nickel transport system substrate-binding protein